MLDSWDDDEVFQQFDSTLQSLGVSEEAKGQLYSIVALVLQASSTLYALYFVLDRGARATGTAAVTIGSPLLFTGSCSPTRIVLHSIA